MMNELDVLLSTGDGSGRPDTSGVDIGKAGGFARRMFWAVVCVRFDECKLIHAELNQDPALYQLSLDLFRKLCAERGKAITGKWREYCE